MSEPNKKMLIFRINQTLFDDFKCKVAGKKWLTQSEVLRELVRRWTYDKKK